MTALFDLNGTATRKAAFRVFAALVGGFLALYLLQTYAPAWARYGYPVVGLLVVWWWTTLVRRLHDAGKSGAWAVLLVVPALGLLVSLAALMLRQGRPYNGSHAGLRLAGTLGLMVVALFFLGRAFWAPYWIPAESMKPTLLVGDYMAVRHVGAAGLKRGDLVVFRHPVTAMPMVKRLIGLPGDRVEMRGGAPVLNGLAVAQTDAGVLQEVYGPQGPSGTMPRCTNAVVGVGGTCEKTLHRETLADGRSYLVADIQVGSFADDIGPFVVPEGQVFVLGDNRDNSADSRFAQGAGGLGFVPAENVIGRVARVVFSTTGAHLWAIWDWRADRMLKAVE